MKHLKNTGSRAALIAAACLLAGELTIRPTLAADIGGDCCADLEERVIELEQTTARKGNRRVSLKISGHIARGFGWYEDEFGASEFYAQGHGPSGSRIQFSGKATLNAEWTAGYKVRLRARGDRPRDTLTNAGLSVPAGNQSVGRDRNYVYLSSKRLGSLSLGHQPMATDEITNISLGGHGVFNNVGRKWNASSLQGFELEQDSAEQAIKYSSPSLSGFVFSMAWGDQDIASNSVGSNDSAVDLIDFAIRYAAEFGSIRFAGGLGYTIADNDESGDGSNIMGSAAILHTPTGLNVAVAAGTELDGGLPLRLSNGTRTGNLNTDAYFWHIEAGIYRNFFAFGKTSLFGEYGHYDYDDPNYNRGGITFTDDSVDMWGLGVVQYFDAASTELFLGYRQWSQDTTNAAALALGHDGEVNQIEAGMRIKF